MSRWRAQKGCLPPAPHLIGYISSTSCWAAPAHFHIPGARERITLCLLTAWVTWIKPGPPLVSKPPVGQSSGIQYLAQLRDEPTVNTAFEHTAQKSSSAIPCQTSVTVPIDSPTWWVIQKAPHLLYWLTTLTIGSYNSMCNGRWTSTAKK